MSKPYPTVTPYLITTQAAAVMAFIKEAFGGTEIHLQKREDGTIAHASLQIEESMVMLSESTTEYPAMPAMVYMYMNDCDSTYHKAIGAGGTSLREPTNEAYGDRSSGVKDPGGNQWWIAGPVK